MNSIRGKEMLKYIPRYYDQSRVYTSLLDVEGAEFDNLRAALTSILDQFFVDTATWGLDIWEKELGLDTVPDQPISERRDRIKSRLRGFGTATITLVKSVAEAYDNGEVEPIEDTAAYTVTIKFVDTTGVPPNINDLKEAVRAIIPAHLEVEYEFKYFTWEDLDAKEWTWDQLDALGLTWNELEVYS